MDDVVPEFFFIAMTSPTWRSSTPQFDKHPVMINVAYKAVEDVTTLAPRQLSVIDRSND